MKNNTPHGRDRIVLGWGVLLAVLVIELWINGKNVSRLLPSMTSMTTPYATDANNTETSNTSNTRLGSSSFCDRLTGESLTFQHRWRNLQPTLLQSFLHPRDTEKIHANWTKDLLQHVLTPHVLEDANRGRPGSHIVENMVNKLSNAEEPLKIAVFGGSVVQGRGCSEGPPPMQVGELHSKIEFQSLQECAWPFRLEHAANLLLRQILPESSPSSTKKWIQVHNLAAGGTSTSAAIPMVRYSLSPVLEEDTPPDIFVNGYSANDNVPNYLHGKDNTTIDGFHLASAWGNNLAFVQTVQEADARFAPSSCSNSSHHHSMILYVNDYIGNQQESIIGDRQTHQAVQWLADIFPGVAYVSTVHAVQRWVYANTKDQFFSAKWKNKRRQPQVDVHFGQGGHMTTAISVLYFLLELMYDHCRDRENQAPNENEDSMGANALLGIDVPDIGWIQEKEPEFIRPNLIEYSRPAVRAQSAASSEQQLNCTTTAKKEPICPFAFLAAPLGTHHNQRALENYIGPFTIKRSGWAAKNDFQNGGFQNKLGLVALEPNATMTLAVPDSSRIRVITMHYLKSYGEKWAGSQIQINAQVLDNRNTTNPFVIYEKVETIQGFHNQTVSISYPFQMTFKPPKDGTFHLHLTLIGGQNFKINALMLCGESTEMQRRPRS